jgi:hypothetical protein
MIIKNDQMNQVLDSPILANYKRSLQVEPEADGGDRC